MFAKSVEKRPSIDGLSLEEQIEHAFAKIVRCVNVREQSSVKMRQKLQQAGYSQDVIDLAMQRAVELSIIDDERYAECLVRSAITSGKGLRFVNDELNMLGVSLEAVESYQEYQESGEDRDLERALELLRRHPPHSKNIRASAFRKLISKGYTYDISERAANLFSKEAAER